MFIETFLSNIFGTRNEREIKKYAKRISAINDLESKYHALSDDELKAAFEVFKESVKLGEKSLEEVLNDVFAITRETSIRTTGLRHFDVQLGGGNNTTTTSPADYYVDGIAGYFNGGAIESSYCIGKATASISILDSFPFSKS